MRVLVDERAESVDEREEVEGGGVEWKEYRGVWDEEQLG